MCCRVAGKQATRGVIREVGAISKDYVQCYYFIAVQKSGMKSESSFWSVKLESPVVLSSLLDHLHQHFVCGGISSPIASTSLQYSCD